MESAIMELELNEIETVTGGNGTDPALEKAFDLVKNIARTAKRCNRTDEDALSMLICAYGGWRPEADIEACVRSVYGL